MRCEGYSTWSVCCVSVCVCVCLLLNISHFTCLFLPQTILTFSKVENVKRFSLKMLRCEARAFPGWYGIQLHVKTAIFTPRKMRMRMNLDHVTSGRFEKFTVSSIIGHWQ